ncbi:MAG TPA: hypothetical protein VFR24_15900 [Candidatus Angelobacter sp.]|nr:hypothetical protein [Candidatus Angelobacter sp.]
MLKTKVKSGCVPYFQPMFNVSLPDGFSVLLFPAGLFVFYLISWLLVGRDPKIQNVAPQYEPPPGVSPGVARYVITGGSDGTTLASVLAGMAAKGVVSIEAVEQNYQLKLLNSKITVWPEEAAIAKTLFHTELPTQSYAASHTAIIGLPESEQQDARLRGQATFGNDVAEASLSIAAASIAPAQAQAELNPALAGEIKAHVGAIQDTFRKNLEGVYFRQNFKFAGIGILATLVWAFVSAASIKTPSSMFTTFWLLMFTSIAGLVLGGVLASKPARPTASQRVGQYLMPLIFFAAPSAMIYFFALPQDHLFVIALLVAVLLNSIFFVLMRAPTALGRTTLQQLAGFREFLQRVDQDRLNRLNTPDRAEAMDKFLPYAIALGVKEGWGDTMAAALSNAIVER